MLLRYMRIVILAAACCIVPSRGLYSADFYVSEYSIGWRTPWLNDMPLRERLDVLTKEGLYVFMKGPIAQGDYATLAKIHSLVPIHTLIISSPGGSVAEALRIAGFVGNYLIKVETDWRCGGGNADSAHCGCASSCAFIWLAAPLRSGNPVRIHRPYFDGAEFQNLPDAVALKKYNHSASAVRSLLQSRGYSQDFIGALFRIPREQAKELTPQEISTLPIDVALDELTSARCYHGNEDKIGRFELINDELARITKEYERLVDVLPHDLEDYELRRDPRYRKDYARWRKIVRQRDNLKASRKSLRRVYYEFRTCKRTERIQASLRKSGQRLTPAIRSKVREFEIATTGIGSTALIAKHAPDHPLGREAVEDLKQRQVRIRALWQELQLSLPLPHRDFIVDAFK